jgi:hypothetical protein
MLDHQLNLLRVEAGVRRRAIRMLNEMGRDLGARLRMAPELSDLSKARLNKLIRDASTSINRYYGRVEREVEGTLTRVADVTARRTASIIEALSIDITAGLPTETFLERIISNTLIQGAPSSEWWARQATDVSFRFGNTVRQGLLAGDTNAAIVSRVAGGRGHPGIMDVTRSNARTLVHTSIQAVANEARKETFRQNDDIIEGIRQVSTLDSHTTDICMAYDGAEFDLDGNPINGTTLPYEGGVPRHWNCRSVEIPITKSFRELGLDVDEPPEGERASSEGPVPASMKFEEYLSGQSKQQQDEQLGAGRAQLWREGKITMSQLLDQNGNPLTLEELEEKYA